MFVLDFLSSLPIHVRLWVGGIACVLYHLEVFGAYINVIEPYLSNPDIDCIV